MGFYFSLSSPLLYDASTFGELVVELITAEKYIQFPEAKRAKICRTPVPPEKKTSGKIDQQSKIQSENTDKCITIRQGKERKSAI